VARKLFRSGNSTVVSLPSEALDALGLEPGDEVTVAADPAGGRIVITPVEPSLPDVSPGFLDEVDRFVDRYFPALDKLARTQGD
jgi:putative addiction module antidote